MSPVAEPASACLGEVVPPLYHFRVMCKVGTNARMIAHDRAKREIRVTFEHSLADGST